MLAIIVKKSEMKFRLLVLILLTSIVDYGQTKELDDYKLANVKNIITLFKQKNIDSISSVINFPLQREYPIPSIKNEKEFKQRFNEVFDKILVDKIAKSKTNQWEEVGYRGIMLDNGMVWIDGSEGKLIAVNYQSNFEKQLKKDLIKKEKKVLYTTLKVFQSPIYKIKTKNYLIRIDKIADYEYRYASWKIGKKESSKPDLILNNGVLEFLGSGGNSVITFSKANYTYKVYRNSIGEDNSPDITLEVEKDKQIILTQDGTLIE